MLGGGRNAERVGVSLSTVLLFYLMGGTVAGAVVGLLRYRVQNRFSAFLVGVVAAAPLSFLCMIALYGAPNRWDQPIWWAVPILSVGFALVGAYALYDPPGGAR